LVNVDVASGTVFNPSCRPTRTEADVAESVRRTVASDPSASPWHLGVDNRDRYRSESLVRCVAAPGGCAVDLGHKDGRGVRRSKATRAAFLRDPTHPSVFHATPRHASWMTQIEIWLSSLVRTWLRCGNLRRVADSRHHVLASAPTSLRPWPSPSRGKPLYV
jgi:hypothetical protein